MQEVAVADVMHFKVAVVQPVAQAVVEVVVLQAQQEPQIPVAAGAAAQMVPPVLMLDMLAAQVS
jgi:hypothetical protein